MMRLATILAILVGCGKSDPAPRPQAPTNEAVESTARSPGSNDTPAALPEGWKEIKRETDRVMFRSADEAEQVTVSKLDLAAEPSFEDFKVLSEVRIAAEHDGADNEISLDATPPSNDSNRYTLTYSGGERGTQRLFSCHMVAVGKTVMTVYVEGIGVNAQRHAASFKAFVTAFGAGQAFR